MLKKLLTTHARKIDYGTLVVNVYEFALSGESTPPEKFKVKVLIDADGIYTCAISHFVHKSGHAGPHRPGFTTYTSEEEALNQAVSHGLMNYDPEDSHAKWEKNDYF